MFCARTIDRGRLNDWCGEWTSDRISWGKSVRLELQRPNLWMSEKVIWMCEWENTIKWRVLYFIIDEWLKPSPWDPTSYAGNHSIRSNGGKRSRGLNHVSSTRWSRTSYAHLSSQCLVLDLSSRALRVTQNSCPQNRYSYM